MGRDKALLPYQGTTLVAHIAARVAAAAGCVTLVGSSGRYRDLPYATIDDLRPGSGPAGGLEAALHASKAEWNLLVACDMPRLTAGFLRNLFEAAETSGERCLVPVSPSGRLEPLCAVYRRDCAAGVSDALARGIRKMTAVVAALGAVHWPVDEGVWFENLNTPGDWMRHEQHVPPLHRVPPRS
jgi:molybdopterin-guanine dinucleotide biosynthesis protein A